MKTGNYKLHSAIVLLAAILVLMLVSAEPLTALAEPVPLESPVVGVLNETHPTEPGQVMLYKEAKPVDGYVNTWDITLRIEGKDTEKTSDTIIVLDRSTSMNGSKMSGAKAAAQSLVSMLLPDTGSNGNRVALITFGSDVLYTGTLQSTKEPLFSIIGGIPNNNPQINYTHTQAALHAAQVLMGPSTADVQTIILLSDGVPTASYQLKDPYSHLIPYGAQDAQTSTTMDPNDFNYSVRVGASGSTIYTRFHDDSTNNDFCVNPAGTYVKLPQPNFNNVQYSTDNGTSWVNITTEFDAQMSNYWYFIPIAGATNYRMSTSTTGPWTDITSTLDLATKYSRFVDGYYNHGNSAIAEARYTKAALSAKDGDDDFLFTIALEVDSIGQQILQTIASPGKYFTAQTGDLQNIFNQIVEASFPPFKASLQSAIPWARV